MHGLVADIGGFSVPSFGRLTLANETGGGEGVGCGEGWNVLWTKRTRRHQRQRQTAAAATDDCCEVCLASSEGFALVSRGHAGFCKSCALRVADLDSGCRYAW